MEPVATAGAAEEDRRLVVEQLAAAVGEDGWPIDQARPLLLAAPGREPPDAATVWKHGEADRLAALASREGEPTTGSDFREERGREAAKCRKHGSKEERLRPLGFSREARMDRLWPVRAPCTANLTHSCIGWRSGVSFGSAKSG